MNNDKNYSRFPKSDAIVDGYEVLVKMYIAICILLLHVTVVRNDKLQDREETMPTIDSDTLKWIHAIYGGLGPVLNSPLNRRPRRSEKMIIKPVPEQIHISYGDNPTEMVVVWSTPSPGVPSVLYGLVNDNKTEQATGTSKHFTFGNPDGLQYLHRVKLKNLTPGSKYTFKVQTDDEDSQPFEFTAMRDGYNWSPNLLIYGDMGVKGGAPTLLPLNREASSGLMDAIIHIGDFAYDLHDEGGKVGDDFMNRIQSLATKLPYMPVVGNHEIANEFSHYRYRFSTPNTDWPIPIDKMWYSFNMGNVHFIIYSTEVFFTYGPDYTQYQWLQADLIKANKNRDKQPWVIALGHRPMYCSNSDGDDCTHTFSRVRQSLEELFHTQGVDVIFQGHEHSYERLYPIFNNEVYSKDYTDPQAPVHIITGAAGCNEFNKICINPMLGPIKSWSAFRAWLPGLYSYGKLMIANATHLQWQQILSVNGQVMDDIWIVQRHHGPFKMR
ncbi:acid phosphatase type 7-like [Antedon mediterranea]|uniref:acid phosphatase type 7-like n=1 Tax=Antedon mediterranea TaxID=105859 RepID=UPI003AF96760